MKYLILTLPMLLSFYMGEKYGSQRVKRAQHIQILKQSGHIPLSETEENKLELYCQSHADFCIKNKLGQYSLK